MMFRRNTKIAMQKRGRLVRADDADDHEAVGSTFLTHEHEHGQHEVLMMMPSIVAMVQLVPLVQQFRWWWLSCDGKEIAGWQDVLGPVFLPRSCRNYSEP